MSAILSSVKPHRNFVYHDCLKSHGAKVYSVPMNSGGMDLDALESLLQQLRDSGELSKVKLIYTVDYFQNPTGLSLAADRRPRLVEIARKYSTEQRILILEDAAYRELRYNGPDLPSIKRFDPGNEYVIYTTTFSKPCAPGLKTGYSILPRELVTPICNLKGGHDFGSTNLSQHIISRMIATGDYDKQVQTLQNVYRIKKDAMVAAVESEFADWPAVTFTRPEGGLYVWVTFPPELNVGRGGPLIDRALENGVLYIPGEFGHVPDEFGHVPKNEVRLSFGVAEPAMITEGVRRLRRAGRGARGAECACGARRGVNPSLGWAKTVVSPRGFFMRLLAVLFVMVVAMPTRADDAPQARTLTELVRPLVLASLPDPLVRGERDWGRQVLAPVGVKWHGLKPITQKSPRNDGHWQRMSAVAIQPDETFELQITDLSNPKPGQTAFTVRMAMNVRGEHELQEWKRGVRVLSTTTQARCRVGLKLDCICTSRVGVVKGSLLPSAEISVQVLHAECGYSDFVCERVGKIHGKPAALAGEAAREFVRLIKPGLETELLTKANHAVMHAVEAKPVRVELDKLLLGQVAAK